MMSRARAAAFFLALLLVEPSSTSAQVVGISFGEGEGRLSRRLSSELRARGYTTRALGTNDHAFRLDGLDAVLSAHDEPPMVRVCVAVAAPRAHCESLTDEDESVLLIRAIELVRAHLGEPAGRADELHRREPPVPAATPAVRRTQQWEIGLAASILPPTGGFSIGAGATATLGFAPHPLIGVELGGLVSLLDPSVGDASGSVSASSRMAWLGIDVRIPESVLAGHRLVFGLAAACAGAELHVSAAPELKARQGALVALALMGRAGLIVHLVDAVGLAIGVRAGAALPQPVLLFEAREVARWGAPFVMLELGLVVRL